MYFKNRCERRETLETIADLFACMLNHCDERTKKALILTQRILSEVDVINDEEQFSGDKEDVF